MLTEGRWLRVKDVADILGVSSQRVSQRPSKPHLPLQDLGNRTKIDREQIFAWLESRRRLLN